NLFTQSLFKSDFPYRPLTLTTHAVEYQMFSLTPFFYYCSNILIHLINALLVYALVLMLTQQRVVAFVSGLIFAIHPAHWETVSFLSGRADLLNALFNLSPLVGCVLYMRPLTGGWVAFSLV